MKLHYHADTVSLHIDLNHGTSMETREVANGVLLDFDDNGALISIDIDQASRLLDLTKLETTSLPLPISVLAT